MSAIVGFFVMLYAIYRAYINYQLYAAANDTYGNEAFWPKDLPNYGYRFWAWVVVGVLSALASGVFGIGGGCGSRMLPC